MDIAVNLVENYLRLNGYLTLSEFEVQRRNEHGAFETATDVDIMAIRMPGLVFAGDPRQEDDCELLLIDDPVLELAENEVDVIIGEVKQGEAQFNPGIRGHEVLHSMLRRVEWLLDEGALPVVEALQNADTWHGAARGGGRVRVRLVAFGRSPVVNLNTISLSHMVRTMLGFMEGLDDAFRPVQFRDPAPGLLSLLIKAGFEVKKELET